MRFKVPVEAWPGIALLLSAALAMWLANGAFASAYTGTLKTELAVSFGASTLAMPLSEWVKNALMAVFFLYAGLELKNELLAGALSNARAAALPLAGALGGMALPAALYLLFAGPQFAQGWAIPAATDIAFALGVLALLGSRVPSALKAFLLAVAVVDDLGAILIIAFFYSGALDLTALIVAAGIILILAAFNTWRTARLGIYMLLAVPLWLAFQFSGINPTIAGVIVALFVPMHTREGISPLHTAEHALRPYVLFGIMPLFALGSAGASLASGVGAALAHPIALAVAAGLAIGKPVGITALTLLAARLLKTPLPGKPIHIIGVAAIAGIGFTMSLFIGKLAFLDEALQVPVKMGVYAGSVVAAVTGLVILARTLPRRSARRVAADQDVTRSFLAQTPDAPQGNTPF